MDKYATSTAMTIDSTHHGFLFDFLFDLEVIHWFLFDFLGSVFVFVFTVFVSALSIAVSVLVPLFIFVPGLVFVPVPVLITIAILVTVAFAGAAVAVFVLGARLVRFVVLTAVLVFAKNENRSKSSI